MGLLDLFRKRKNGEIKMKYGGTTFWTSPPITNDEYQRIRQSEADLLERKYDLSTVKGINAIPVPRQKASEPGGGIQSVTSRIEYYLMHKAGVYEKSGEVELALACYRKANALMPVSPVEYQYDAYMRLPRYLRKLRRFDEAIGGEIGLMAYLVKAEPLLSQIIGLRKEIVSYSEL